jgi:Ni/Fe-hydrogenase subunit HybB-like protein
MFKNETGSFYDKLLKIATFLAIPVTLYTAVIMGEASARELWQTPAELIQMALAAFLVGAGVLALFSDKWSERVRRDIGIIMAMSAFLMFTVYMGEYFLSWKLAEAEATMAYVHSGGKYNFMFWVGQLALVATFVLAFMATRSGSTGLLKMAAILSLIGLYIAKHVWLVIPQLLSLS